MNENYLNENLSLDDLKKNKYIENCNCEKYKKRENNEDNENNYDSTYPTNENDNKNKNQNIKHIFNVIYKKGRKEKNDESIRKNDKNCEKNICKKMRTNYHKFLKYHLILLKNKYSFKHKIYGIQSNLVININRKDILELYQMSIKQFFSQKITKKVKSQKKSNIKVLNFLLQIDEIKDFLNKNYLDVFYSLFLMNRNKYEKEYGKNDFLFENIKLDDLEKEIWLKIIHTNLNNNEYGLINYYKNKHGRKLRKNNQPIEEKFENNITINENESNNDIIEKRNVHPYVFGKIYEIVNEIF